MNPIKFQISVFIYILLLWGCSKNKQNISSEAPAQYACPMHPTVIQDQPGSCPVCGMDLVNKGSHHEEEMIATDLDYMLKPVNASVISSIKTIRPVRKAMDAETQVNGVITYDTRRVTSIPIRFGGRIERLFIRYNFQPVRKGQKILEIYSPELLTAQRDLIYLLKSDKDNEGLIRGAKEKLSLLGIPDGEINKLVITGEQTYAFTVYSPVDGYVVEETAGAATVIQTTAVGGSMTSDQPNAWPAIQKEILIREGMYISAGQPLFKVINTDKVWAEFDVYQREAGFIQEGDSVKITLDDTRKLDAVVNFVQPFLEKGEGFSKIRVYLSNAIKPLRMGQLAVATFKKHSKEFLWIPVSARMDLGNQQIVFVKQRNIFQARKIITARESKGWIEVLGGLELTDSIAYRAQFMVDSEGFVKVGN